MSYIDSKKLIELVELTKNTSKNNQADWVRVRDNLNELYKVNHSKGYYRSKYRRVVNDPTYSKKSTRTYTHEETKPIDDEYVKPKKISIEIEGNGTQRSELLLDIVTTPLKTPLDILSVHGYDVGQWELVKHSLKIWNSYSKQDGTHELYSSALTVKPIKNSISIDNIERAILSTIDKYFIEDELSYQPFIKREYNKNMALLSIFDLHLGKLGWRFETNNDYDLQIAEKLYNGAIDDLVSRIDTFKPEIILIPFGSDFFHYDNDNQTTTAGTPQDTDTRLPKMFEKGLDLIIRTVERALEICDHVVFMNVSGNHDYNLSYYAASVVNRLYKDNPRVELIFSPISRKYYEYGQNLLGFTHGNEEGKNLVTLMQEEEKEAWGRTTYREWMLGHLHHEIRKEHNGFVINTLSSLSGADKYHFNKGYVGSKRKAQAFIYNYDYGRIEEIITPIELIKDKFVLE